MVTGPALGTLTLGDGLTMFGLFEGYGGLTIGLQRVLGGRLVGYAEYEPPTKKQPRPTQAPARILAHHYPHLTNYGDVSAIDWAQVLDECGRIDVLAGGFPCQDVSHAGLRAGIATGTRSGLWYEFARAIATVRPALVLIENVPGLRSARAGDPEEVTDEEPTDAAETGRLEPDAGAVGDTDGRNAGPVQLRALGAVLGDLAELGYDTEWVSVRASDVGAPHRRERVFVLAFARELAAIDDPRGLVA